MSLRLPSPFRRPPEDGTLSVIIPVYRDEDALGATLSSLARQEGLLFRVEVLVANDGGEAEISALCRTRGVREIQVRPSGGSYRARNAALAESGGARLAFIDAGNIVSAGWCAEGWRALQAADYVGGGVAFEKPRVETAAYLYQVAWGFPVETYLEREHYAPTANLFVRRSVFAALGEFDSRLRSSGDLEFGRRVFEAGGFRQLFCPALELSHPPRSLAELFHKQRRVREGQTKLNRLYPGRFPGLGPSWVRAALSLLPPMRVRWNKNLKACDGRWRGAKIYGVAYLLRLYGGFLDLREMVLGD